jgi:hypothetical protein
MARNLNGLHSQNKSLVHAVRVHQAGLEIVFGAPILWSVGFLNRYQ